MQHVAQFAGKCEGCGQTIGEGDEYEYTAEDERIGVACCGFVDEPRADSRYDARMVNAAIALVMPPGRTKADACPRCFQIPSLNGVCGCDQ